MKKRKSKLNVKLIAGSSFILGIVAVMLLMFIFAPSIMMIESESKYDFDETVERFREIVDDSSWGILNTHNMQEIKANLGYEVLPVKVFDLCSGHYSYQILREDDERIVTPMMPCRISIYEKSNGKTYIGRMNSGLVARLFGGIISDVMQNATRESEEILQQLIA